MFAPAPAPIALLHCGHVGRGILLQIGVLQGRGMSVEPLSRVREATIQFSDVFGEIPTPLVASAPVLPDFDAILTAKVRNCGHFTDSQFAIGAWRELGGYGAVLIEELRWGQLARALEYGLDPAVLDEDTNLHVLHPDVAMLARSLTRAIVVVVNSAPRTADHHARSENGDEFYVAVTRSGVEVYAQAHFLAGLAARSWITALFRIPNGSGAWADGEQFRSSCVTQVRSRTELLVKEDLSVIPLFEAGGRVAYADTFGNVRVEVPHLRELAQRLATGGSATVTADGGRPLEVRVVSRLTGIPEGELGLYLNPADVVESEGPGYLELARRVSSPVNNPTNAYRTLVESLGEDPAGFDPAQWSRRSISIS